MDEYSERTASALEFEEDASVRRSVVGAVRARDVHLERAVAGVVAAGGNVSVLNGGCGPVAAGGSLTITNGGCGPVLANGSVTIVNGGCGPMVANGDVSIESGGTQSIIAAGDATIGERAYVGFVLSPKVTVEDGATVLMSTPQALAFGAALGGAVALLVRLFRR